MKIALIALATLTVAVAANAQDYQVRPRIGGGGWEVYHQGQLQQRILPTIGTGGYNVYGTGGQLQQTILPRIGGGGYNIHTMPSSQFNRW
jgi:hypothetical protein